MEIFIYFFVKSSKMTESHSQNRTWEHENIVNVNLTGLNSQSMSINFSDKNIFASIPTFACELQWRVLIEL